MKRVGVLLSFAIVQSFFVPSALAAGAWKGEIPAEARDSARWESLGDTLLKSGMPFGAMAASGRMLSFFGDLATKESAYKRIVDLIDEGYPLSGNEMKELFSPGDLEPRGDAAFSDSYNFEKFAINQEKGMDRWAKQYSDRLSGAEVAKYQYFLAIRSYAEGSPAKADEAVVLLKKILSADSGEGSGALAENMARTLARIYFEKKQYDKSLDVYRSFLLKLNPIHPADWLEAAWDEYYLKHYPEVIGLLYNLESKTGGAIISLEKYTLRALVYRENCAVQNAQALIESFEKDFGPALAGLKEGRSPEEFPILAQVETGAGSAFLRLQSAQGSLRNERARIDLKLPENQRALARYLYDSEARLLDSQAATVRDVTMDRSGEELIMIAEHLKFLKYDVARQKFDPDRVFKKDAASSFSKVTASGSTVRWTQRGDFWRDERINYKGAITQQCE